MRRALLIGFTLCSSLVVSGCPIYPEEPYACSSHADCADGEKCDYESNTCYVPGGGTGGSSSGVTCDAPSDCGPNETCSSSGQCRIGDCSFHGCVSGWQCTSDSGVWECTKSSGSGGGAGAGGAAGAAGQAGAAGGAGAAGAAGAAGGAGQAGSAGAAGAAGGAGAGSAGAAGSTADAGADDASS